MHRPVPHLIGKTRSNGGDPCIFLRSTGSDSCVSRESMAAYGHVPQNANMSTGLEASRRSLLFLRGALRRNKLRPREGSGETGGRHWGSRRTKRQNARRRFLRYIPFDLMFLSARVRASGRPCSTPFEASVVRGNRRDVSDEKSRGIALIGRRGCHSVE